MSYDEEEYERWKQQHELKQVLRFYDEEAGLDVVDVLVNELDAIDLKDKYEQKLLDAFIEEYNEALEARSMYE
jgi:hypothetical protein